MVSQKLLRRLTEFNRELRDYGVGAQILTDLASVNDLVIQYPAKCCKPRGYDLKIMD